MCYIAYYLRLLLKKVKTYFDSLTFENSCFLLKLDLNC